MLGILFFLILKFYPIFSYGIEQNKIVPWSQVLISKTLGNRRGSIDKSRKLYIP